MLCLQKWKAKGSGGAKAAPVAAAIVAPPKAAAYEKSAAFEDAELANAPAPSLAYGGFNPKADEVQHASSTPQAQRPCLTFSARAPMT